ncbi:MAG: sugar phosphate isomerase/epimerase [Sedimentisphaerales bacterium]|nr:sugar phosphate isomerase/epimerase [Sedimentisphaerales bacterium]
MAGSARNSSATMSRREFCRAAVGVAAAFGLGPLSAGQAPAGANVKFYQNLGPGHLGVRANQRQALDYAVRYGFASITPEAGEFADRSASEIKAWVETMKEAGVRYGAAGLPAEFRRDEQRFQSDLKQLPAQANILQQLGVTRVATWVLPGHDELTYLENFEQHRRRLKAAAQVLADHGIRLGLEFIGPRTARARSRFPFVCAQRDMMELVAAIDVPGTGLLLDSWHWYTSHGTVDELLRLSNRDVVHVHVNDAPAGVPVDQQVDNRRCLPVTTGVIDMKGFINALAKIGYDGPVECEPFDAELRQAPPEAALRKTIDALDRAWKLIEV